MTMGPWGIHYERTNTWWEQSRAWLAYLARCQALLQTGQFVADIAYLGTEEAPNSFPARESMQPSLPQGYDFDDLPPEALLTHASVRDGRLVLASGMSYRLLVLPPAATMRPAVLAKLRELVSAGLTVLGPRPSSSPSLADYPHCDNQVQQLGEELWGECDGSGVTENPYGKGKIVWGMPVADVLRALDTPPDFACHQTAVGQQIRYIHRSVGGEEAYFVASGVAEARRFLCTFRVKGKRPELWWPDTGRIEPIVVYDEVRTGTEIPLSLDPYGSVFVVFRSQGAPVADRVVSVRHDSVEISGLTRKPAPEVQLQDELCVVRTNQAGQYSIESAEPGIYELKTAAGHVFKAQVPELLSPLVIEGPWQLAFPKGWGAPEQVRLPRLISWTEHSDPGVKYFSGTATYHRRVEAPEEMMAAARVLSLDLGRVGVIAQVKLNGRDLGILWKPPFRVDVTGILHLGPNDLEVSVVNLWPNRLIGDEQLPPDCEFAALPSFGGMDRGGPLAKYPQWLLDNKPSPAGRFTFTTWKHWTKDDPLQESGLLGPVRIIVHTRVAAV
jgi:hypothetical protein